MWRGIVVLALLIKVMKIKVVGMGRARLDLGGIGVEMEGHQQRITNTGAGKYFASKIELPCIFLQTNDIHLYSLCFVISVIYK